MQIILKIDNIEYKSKHLVDTTAQDVSDSLLSHFSKGNCCYNMELEEGGWIFVPKEMMAKTIVITKD